MTARTMTIAVFVALLGVQPSGSAPHTDVTAFQFDLIAGYTVRAAELMPERDYAFRPADSVRTFAQLVGHVADASYLTCALAGKRSSPNRRSLEALTSKAELVTALKGAVSYCAAVFATRLSGGLAHSLPGSFPFAAPGSTMTGTDVATFTMAHTFEHYGNMVIYLRMRGIEPPSTTDALAAVARRRDGQTAIRTGRLLLPAAGAMSYMLSSKQHLNARMASSGRT